MSMPTPPPNSPLNQMTYRHTDDCAHVPLLAVCGAAP